MKPEFKRVGKFYYASRNGNVGVGRNKKKALIALAAIEAKVK